MTANKIEVSYHMMFDERIPNELLFEILVRLPAQDIYFGARLVCHKWYHLIKTKNFIHEHLEQASYGLLYTDVSKNLVFATAREDCGGTIDTNKLNHNYKDKLRTTVRSSWNGLTLECGSPVVITNGYHYITNVLTGQIFCLPPCPYYSPCYDFCAIGYDAASRTYKVVMTYQDESTIESVDGCAILTVGVDKSWRIVPTDHLSLRGKYTLWSYPITTEGFVHWKESLDTKVVSLNLETEIITETTPPKVGKKNARTWYLSTERYLSLFVRCGRWAWEVFEIKPAIGEWRKFADIYLEGQKGRIERLGFKHAYIEPFGWLKYPEVLALRVNYDVIIFYNIVTCEIGTETLSTTYNTSITLHKNSLVWLDGP